MQTANTTVDLEENGGITTFATYNTLMAVPTSAKNSIEISSESGIAADSGALTFLGNSTLINKRIQSITFKDSLSGAGSNAWDVSAAKDGSIKAWYETTSANGYNVYIGSDSTISLNQDSSYLFCAIAASTDGYVTSFSGSPIKNLGIVDSSNVTNARSMFHGIGYGVMTGTFSLKSEDFDASNITNMLGMFCYVGKAKMTQFSITINTSSATNMQAMFHSTGVDSMTSFSLGSNFSTSNVTNMTWMFYHCGLNAMKSLSLGSKFNTSKVTNMGYMFQKCGYTAMTSFSLGSYFDTSNVTNMTHMFRSCGYTAMTSFSLGSKFNTSKVTNTGWMFCELGYKKLTSLNLGSNFNTSNVTYMGGMFASCGYTAMTTLNLGSNFDTSKVTNMYYMFNQCGYKKLTSLNLGKKFNTSKVTNMAIMFNSCGYESLATVELGPGFTKIPSGNISINVDGDVQDASWQFGSGLGKSGCIVYCVNDIYKNEHAFKLSASSSTTREYTRGTINPTSDGMFSGVVYEETEFSVIGEANANTKYGVLTPTRLTIANNQGYQLALLGTSSYPLSIYDKIQLQVTPLTSSNPSPPSDWLTNSRYSIDKSQSYTSGSQTGYWFPIMKKSYFSNATGVYQNKAYGIYYTTDAAGNTIENIRLLAQFNIYVSPTEMTYEISNPSTSGFTYTAKGLGTDVTSAKMGVGTRSSASDIMSSTSATKASSTSWKLNVSTATSGKEFFVWTNATTQYGTGFAFQATNVVIDSTPPTCTVTANVTSPTNASSITYTFTFSEEIQSFESNMITVTNGNVKSVSGSGTTYTAVIENSGSCTQTVKVAANKVKDLAENYNTAASNTLSMTIDRTAPTCTITSNPSGSTTASSITYTFAFSEDVTGFAASDITVTNTGDITSTKKTLSGSGKNYTMVVTNSGNEGTQKVSIAAGAGKDSAQNNSSAASSPVVTIDRGQPTCTITANKTSPTNASSITYTFSFSENVTGFVASDVTVTSTGDIASTKGTLSGSGKTYTMVITNTGNEGTQTVSIAAGAGEDSAGNDSSAASKEMKIDKVAPTVTITASEESPTNASSITYTFTFSEIVTGFASGDVTVTTTGATGTKSTFTDTTAAGATYSTYTLVVTNSGSCTQTVSIAAGACTDTAGNNNIAASLPEEIEIDRTAPTLEITASKTSPTNASTVTYYFEFSEKVYDFSMSDTQITNEDLSDQQGAWSFSSTGKSYSQEVDNAGSCIQTVTVPAGVCTDEAGNGNEEATFTMVIDRTAPTWNADVSNKSYDRNAQTYTLNLTGSDETELNAASSSIDSKVTVTVNGQSKEFTPGTATTNGNTKTFPITIKDVTQSGPVVITIAEGALVDTAGNTSVAKTYSFDLDITQPKVQSITANKTSPTNAESITYTIKFDETVTGFTTEDVTVTNGTKGTFAGSGDTYTLEVTNTGNCTQTVTVGAGVCTDTSSNTNLAAEEPCVMVIDRTVPVWNAELASKAYSASDGTYTVRIVGTDESALNDTASVLSSSNVTVTINNVAVSADDLDFGTTVLNDKTKTFPLTIKNFRGGTVKITIAAGGLVDTAGNTSALKEYEFIADVTAPYWADSVSNVAYDADTDTLTLDLIGKEDETSLNDEKSVISESYRTNDSEDWGGYKVWVDGTELADSKTQIGTPTLSDDGKTKTFPLTITDFTSGRVKITIQSKTLEDAHANKNEEKTYEFDVDVIAPVWEQPVGTYNPEDQSYTITITGKDETKINNDLSDLNTSNITLTVGGTPVTPTITTTSTTATSENYTITWPNHTGGAISLTINKGALVDGTSNKNEQTTFNLSAVDATKPVWASTISGETFNWDTRDYTINFVGTDETGLNDANSVLSASNITVIAGGVTVSSSDLDFSQEPTLSDDGKTKTFPVTIKNFTGGNVSITISSNALRDTTGNGSNAKTYTYFKDVTRPVWAENISGASYNHSTQDYSFNLVASDETGLNDSGSVLSGNITIKIDGTATGNFTVGDGTLNGKEKTFPVSISNYTGGLIEITINAGAVKDTSNNTSLQKIYPAFTPDITRPNYSYQNAVYDPDNMTYSVEIVGTDETELDTTLSTLIGNGANKNVTVTSGGTTVTPEITTVSTSTAQIVYKLTVTDYAGGDVVILIDEGGLIDISGNGNEQKEITLPAKDIIKPTWSAQNNEYSEADKTYTFELVATDNDALDPSVTLVPSGEGQNITVTCGTTPVTPTITREISSNQIVYTVTISDYPSGIVYVDLAQGAAKDVTGNKSEPDDFQLAAKDIAKPVWDEDFSVNYIENQQKITITLTGRDETLLNDTKSVLSSLNTIVTVGGTTLDSSRVTFETATLSADYLTKTFPITINNYTGGKIEISTDVGALEDGSGKVSDAGYFEIIDIIKPEWQMVNSGVYDKVAKSFTITLKGYDEDELVSGELNTSNYTVTVAGTPVTITPQLIAQDSQSKTYSVVIPNFTGGTISIGINANTLTDKGGNSNDAATFTLTPDITLPTWTYQNAGYSEYGGTAVTVELIGSDNLQLSSSTLILSDLTVTEGGTTVESSRLSLSTVTSNGDGKGGVKYVLTISGYSGGAISVTIPDGILTDASGNTNNQTTLSIGAIVPPNDNTPPVVDQITPTISKGEEAIYIEFDVTDEHFDFLCTKLEVKPKMKTLQAMCVAALNPYELNDLFLPDAPVTFENEMVHAKLFSDLNGIFMFGDEDKPHEDVEGECMILCFNVPYVWNIRDAVIPCDKRIAVFQLQEATKSLLKDDIDWEARLGCLYAAGQSS